MKREEQGVFELLKLLARSLGFTLQPRRGAPVIEEAEPIKLEGALKFSNVDRVKAEIEKTNLELQARQGLLNQVRADLKEYFQDVPPNEYTSTLYRGTNVEDGTIEILDPQVKGLTEHLDYLKKVLLLKQAKDMRTNFKTRYLETDSKIENMEIKYSPNTNSTKLVVDMRGVECEKRVERVQEQTKKPRKKVRKAARKGVTTTASIQKLTGRVDQGLTNPGT